MARLTVVASPIGNLGDMSPRCLEALGAADFWIVEDSRVSAALQAAFGLNRPLRVMNEHTAPAKVAQYASDIQASESVALLTDAGAPGISDPGAALVDQCVAAGVEIDAIPGPSAVTTALMLSGFYAQRFAFLGFLARKPGAIRSEVAPYADSPLTLVFFESPFRIAALLKVCHEVLGARRYAICREMTKRHQQVWRGTLPEIPNESEVPHKGEVTLVIEGRRKSA